MIDGRSLCQNDEDGRCFRDIVPLGAAGSVQNEVLRSDADVNTAQFAITSLDLYVSINSIPAQLRKPHEGCKFPFISFKTVCLLSVGQDSKIILF